MFRNYLTVAIRSFLNRKLYSFINIAGLAVSLTCAIFITLFIRDELSFDAWEPDSAGVYQVTTHFNMGGEGILANWFTNTPWPAAKTMNDEMSGISAAATKLGRSFTADVGNRQFSENGQVASENFFDVIRLPFARGDAKSALARPDSIVLTERAAKKYFGTDNAIGRTMTLEAKYRYRVSAVLKDPPKNTQFTGDFYIPAKSPFGRDVLKYQENQWFSVDTDTFIRLTDGTTPADIERQIPTMTAKHADPRKVTNINMTGDKFLLMKLIRLKDMHLESSGGTVNPAGRTLVTGFAAIALMILAIACFNFTNLSTAIASMRAREVALRKTVGARRKQLITQFLTESVLTAMSALLIALVAVEVLLPIFNGFLDRDITISYVQDFPVFAAAIVMAIFCGLIGGIYPALVLSGFRPGIVLKSNRSASQGSGAFRNILVVVQFAISIGLGIAALVVFSQINYARKIDMGFDRNNIVTISNAHKLKDAQAESLARRLARSPDIVSVSRSSGYPLGGGNSGTQVILPGSAGEKVTGRIIYIDPQYIPTYGMKILAGRNFDPRRGNDRMNGLESANDVEEGKNVLIDSRMAERLGLTPKDAIGKTIKVGIGKLVNAKIIGVVGFARYYGIRSKSGPVVYANGQDIFRNISVRIRPGHVQQALKTIDAGWHDVAPGSAILRKFINEEFDSQFESINRQATMFTIFVAIAIFTACLGLFGLAAFTAERRKKEIGIRKVFGARRRDIVRILLWQFSVPVIVANVIAWPVAYFWLLRWLEGYAYHITISLLYFLVSGGIALVIAWTTIVAHALKIASASPIVALQCE